MQTFSYKRPIDPQDAIIDKPKKKINVQQRVFTSFFAVVFIVLGWYFSRDMFVATFEGNIISYQGESNLMNDIFLLDIKVESGDIINAGDTMFYFLYTDMLYSGMNPDRSDGYEQQRLAFDVSRSEKIVELQSVGQQIKTLEQLRDGVTHNIPLGLNDQMDQMDYSIEIEARRQKYNFTKKRISLYSRYIDSISFISGQYLADFLNPFENTNEYMDKNLHRFGEMLHCLVAHEKTLILAINEYPGNVVFKGEPIMLIYPIEGGRERIHIEMIVKPRFLNEMIDGDKVDIQFGSQYMGTGTIQINNTYMRSVSSLKLGKFSTEKEGAIIRVDIDHPEKLSLKYQISGLPVKLKYKRRWNRFNKKD